MPRILYPALTQPVLVSDTASRWDQPLSVPVRRVGLAAAVVAASGAFSSPFIPAAAETVSLDKWLQPLSLPAKARPVAEEAALSLVQAAPFPEAVSADRWFQPLAIPASRRPVAEEAALTFVQAEAVTPDRWVPPLATPTRRPYPVPGHIGFVQAAPFAETVTLDRWHAPFSVPVLRGGLPTPEQPYLALVKASLFAESVSLDRWQQPFSTPVWQRSQHAALAAGLSYSTAVIPAALDGWYRPLSEPTRAGRVPEYPPTSFSCTAVPVDIGGWHRAVSEPAGARRAAEHRALSYSYAVLPTKIDGWQAPLSVPARVAARQHQALSYGYYVASSAENITVDKWLSPFSRPVSSAGLPVGEQPALSFVKAAPFAEAVSLDRWIQPISTPVRGTRRAEYPAVSFVYPAPVETVTLDKWLAPLSIPARAGMRQYPGLTYAYFVPAPGLAWFGPLALPNRRVGQAGGQFAASFAAAVTFDLRQPLALPVMAKRAATLPALSYAYYAPESVTLDKWFAPLGQPVRGRWVQQFPVFGCWGISDPPFSVGPGHERGPLVVRRLARPPLPPRRDVAPVTWRRLARPPLASARLIKPSLNRRRLVRPLQGTAPVRLPNFDPIAPDEKDSFSFDFAKDLGTATIQSAVINGTVAEDSPASDSAPQSRVLSAPQITGSIVAILLGTMLEDVLYDIEAVATLSDSRILSLRAYLSCEA